MHIVIIDQDTVVPTHIFICHNDLSKEKKKALELKQELIFARALGEELAISRSLFALTTPTTYEIFLVKDRHEENDYDYRYSRSRCLKKVSEWLMHDRCVLGFDNTVVAIDSEDLTITITARPSARVLIEGSDGYEVVRLDEEITKLFP